MATTSAWDTRVAPYLAVPQDENLGHHLASVEANFGHYGVASSNHSLSQSLSLLHQGSRGSTPQAGNAQGDPDACFGKIELLKPWIPDVDPARDQDQAWRFRSSKRKFVLWSAFSISTIVLAINIACLIVLKVKHKHVVNGVIPIYTGSCTKVKLISILSHLGINILSTLLLGASNLCMQLLVAPTRQEIDRAHGAMIWLDIGIPSVRNLRYIRWDRTVLAICLALSSVPLHFVYNSAITTSLYMTGYPALVASEAFLHGAPTGNVTQLMIDSKGSLFSFWPPADIWNPQIGLADFQANASNPYIFDRLSRQECLERYTDPYADRPNLVVVTENRPEDYNKSVHQYQYISTKNDYANWNIQRRWPCYDVSGMPYPAVCARLSAWDSAVIDAWNKFGRQVLYCLSKRSESSKCRVNYSSGIFAVVIGVSALKCACIFMTIRKHREQALSTLGDAISTFLERPDAVTTHVGTVNESDFRRKNSSVWTRSSTTIWTNRPHYWYEVPRLRRWIVTILLCTAMIVVVFISIITGAHGTHQRNLGKVFSWQMRQSIGHPDPDAFTGYGLPRSGSRGFLMNVMYANMYQVIVSLLYLMYNATLTCMLVGREWHKFARRSKTLRVTKPRGMQRSSYFVSMPWKYGIPLMLTNSILHWMISQSIFVISTIAYYPGNVENEQDSFTVTGYSISACVYALIVGTIAVIVLVALSGQKLSKEMPLASTNSAVISAACHAPEQDTDAMLLPIEWGVITKENVSPARCSFTTLQTVRRPKLGEALFGYSELDRITWKNFKKSGLSKFQLLASKIKFERKK